MPDLPSPLYRLIEERLNGTLLDFVLERWPASGWRKIAEDIKQETEIEVSYNTLRSWFVDRFEVTTTVRVA